MGIGDYNAKNNILLIPLNSWNKICFSQWILKSHQLGWLIWESVRFFHTCLQVEMEEFHRFPVDVVSSNITGSTTWHDQHFLWMNRKVVVTFWNCKYHQFWLSWIGIVQSCLSCSRKSGGFQTLARSMTSFEVRRLLYFHWRNLQVLVGSASLVLQPVSTPLKRSNQLIYIFANNNFLRVSTFSSKKICVFIYSEWVPMSYDQKTKINLIFSSRLEGWSDRYSYLWFSPIKLMCP